MPNRPRTNLDSHSAHQAVYQTEILSDSKVLHQDIKDAQTTTNNKLDSLSGAINNASIGDGTVKLQTYCYGHDVANGQARALKVDANGRLECNVADIELHTGDIALSVDGLETLIGTTNTKLQEDLNFAGQPNSIGDGSNMKRVMNYGYDSSGGQQRPLRIDGDGHLQVDVLSTVAGSGSATEAKQDIIEATLTNIETATQLIDDTVTVQSASHPSKAFAVGGRYYVDNTFRDIRVDNIGKVIIDTPTGSDLDTRLATIGTNTTGLNNCVSGNELQVDVVSMPTTTITGTITANLSSTDNAVLDAIAVDGDNIQTKLDTLNTSLTNGTTISKIMGSEDGATTGTQRQIHVDGSGNVQCNVVNTIFQVPANSANSHITDDPANAMAVGLRARTTIGTATTEQFLNCDSAGSLSVAQKKTYSSETSIISSQSVAGSGTHTTSSIANDANITDYIMEHNFSGSDVSYEIFESIDNTNFFNAMGMSFNEAGNPSSGITGLNVIQIKSPHFKVKFTNGNGSSRDVTLSFVAIKN